MQTYFIFQSAGQTQPQIVCLANSMKCGKAHIFSLCTGMHCMRLYLANVGVTTCNAFEGFWRELPPRSPRRRKWHINYILTFHSRYKFATANCWPPAFSGWSPNPPSANPVYLTVCPHCVPYLYLYLHLYLYLSVSVFESESAPASLVLV